jgi:DNA polymerase III epsilon subunit-like protein
MSIDQRTHRVGAPIRPTHILVFDTETTGLFPKQDKSAPPIPLSAYPYITQASFIIYDLSQERIIETYDYYIKVPEHVVISDEITRITKITKDMCNRGKDITDFLEHFYNAYLSANVLVGHNIDFDIKMISLELERNRDRIRSDCLSLFNKSIEELRNVDRYCTMRRGTNICNIIVENSNRKKWPKLTELYVKLFNEPPPENMHNSLVDIKATLKCYLKMSWGI